MGAQHGGQDRCMAQAAQPAIKYDAVVGSDTNFCIIVDSITCSAKYVHARLD
jgi:hypothetical protein